jgi:hypothetical protein
MSKLAHSNQETMDQIEEEARRTEHLPDEPPETPLQEALRLANADKASMLARIESEVRSAQALPDTGQINNLLRAGRLGALYTLKETFIAAGWSAPRTER